MARIVFGMNQSLDGYVDHQEFAPDPALFRHWIGHVRGLTGSVYGRRMYEVMRYWDEDRLEIAPCECVRHQGVTMTFALMRRVYADQGQVPVSVGRVVRGHLLEYGGCWGARERATVLSSTAPSASSSELRAGRSAPTPHLSRVSIAAAIRGLKTQLVGEISVSGPELAQSLTDLGLIDEYRLYFHPVVLGRGKPSGQRLDGRVDRQIFLRPRP